MPERFPRNRMVKRLRAIEHGLQLWIEHYSSETTDQARGEGPSPYQARLEHLVGATARIQEAMYELAYLKR